MEDGKPCDRGTVTVEDVTLQVSEITKIKGMPYAIVNSLPNNELDLPKGTQILCKLDWHRRYKMMVCHTAAPIKTWTAVQKQCALILNKLVIH